MAIRLAWASPDESALDDRPMRISLDGVLRTVEPPGSVSLTPGESITIPPRLCHSFYAEPGRGRVLVGEVSSVNDDKADNRFLEPVSRFPEIEEDEESDRLLCNEYPPSV